MRALDAKHYLLSVSLRGDDVPDFDRYPFSLPAVKELGVLELHPRVTFLIGENGSGKSTLIEAIAIACGMNPEGGSQNFRFSTRASHSDLHAYLRIVRSYRRPRSRFFLRAESYFNLATEVESLGVGGYGARRLHEQSHGESFFALFDNRLGPQGLYILDEPEAALSPTRQLRLLGRIRELCDQGSQFVIATHSPIIMGYPDAKIVELSAGGVGEIDYFMTEHYAVTKRFLTQRDRVLADVLGDE